MTAMSLANQCRISPGTEVGFSWLGLGVVFIFHLYRATVTVQLQLCAGISCMFSTFCYQWELYWWGRLSSWFHTASIGKFDEVSSRKNISDSFTCVEGFPVVFCFLSRNLANAYLHFVAFYLVCVWNTCFTSNLSGRFFFFFLNERQMRRQKDCRFLGDEMRIVWLLERILILALLSNFCNSLWIPLTQQGA